MLHRPYIRQEVRQEVENRAQKNNKGQFLDANTHKPIDGKYDLGHKPGHEFWREAEKAEKEGLTQEQFNNRMNNPDIYHIESPHENRSHSHEMPKTQTNSKTKNANSFNKGEKTNLKNNDFLESIKADKETLARLDQVSKNAAKNENMSKSKKNDDSGRERGDEGPLSLGRESGNKGRTSSMNNTSNSGNLSAGKTSPAGQTSGGQTSGGQGSGGQGSGGQGSGGQGSGGQGSGGQGGH